MSHTDAGNYAAKHGNTSDLNPEVVNLISSRRRERTIACADAHEIAMEVGIPPAEIGRTIDILEIRINRCQLGLFGHDESSGKVVLPWNDVDISLEKAIREKTDDGRVSCLSLWNISEATGRSKFDMTSACNALGIKICCCQLGAFGR